MAVIPFKSVWSCHGKNYKKQTSFTSLVILLYSTKPIKKISKTSLKHYNQFRSVRNEALIWLQITTDTVNKLKVKTKVKEGHQQLLNFITIYFIKVEQQQSLYHNIISLPMTPIINIYFNKHPMSWELIHLRLLRSSDSFMKAIWCHQTLTGLTKHCPIYLNEKIWQLYLKAQILTQLTFKQDKLFILTSS